MSHLDFRGTYTALITPFRDGAVDYATLRKIVERQIKAGIQGLVAVGTTGESPTLSVEEHLGVISEVVQVSAGRVPVIAGTGANATQEALYLVAEAEKRGADAHLQVAPYYNKPSQEGLYRHFCAVAESTSKPIILYSVPGRCGIEIGVDVVKRLAEQFPHVRTIKEAGGVVTRVSQLLAAVPRKLSVLCGDDGLTVPFISTGAVGVISVASNLAPEIMVRLTESALAGRTNEALELHRKYYALLTDLVFLEGNPVSIKAAMHEAGLLETLEMRLPLVPPSPANHTRIRTLVQELGLRVHGA